MINYRLKSGEYADAVIRAHSEFMKEEGKALRTYYKYMYKKDNGYLLEYIKQISTAVSTYNKKLDALRGKFNEIIF